MKRASAVRRLLERNRIDFSDSPPIKNSDHFAHLPDYVDFEVQFGDRPILVPTARVSGRDQYYRDNLESQCVNLAAVLKLYGLPPIDPFREVCSGWRFDDRGCLEAAANLARNLGGGLLFESVGRALRPYNFKHDDPELAGASIRQAEMEIFLSIVGDVPLVTVLPPDTGWRAVRSYETKRGIEYREAQRGAKPDGYKKAIRDELRPRARALRVMGWTVQQIVEELNRPERTIYRWIRGLPFFGNEDS